MLSWKSSQRSLPSCMEKSKISLRKFCNRLWLLLESSYHIKEASASHRLSVSLLLRSRASINLQKQHKVQMVTARKMNLCLWLARRLLFRLLKQSPNLPRRSRHCQESRNSSRTSTVLSRYAKVVVKWCAQHASGANWPLRQDIWADTWTDAMCDQKQTTLEKQQEHLRKNHKVNYWTWLVRKLPKILSKPFSKIILKENTLMYLLDVPVRVLISISINVSTFKKILKFYII